MASSGSESEAESFEVQEIIDKRGRGRNLEYLVKWRGYDEQDSTWEPARNLRHSQNFISLYEEKTPSVSQKKSVVQKRATMSGRTTTRTVTTTTKLSKEIGTPADRSIHVKELVARSLASGSQSESSSRENSPTLGRRTLRQRYTLETTTPVERKSTTTTTTTSTTTKTSGDSSFAAATTMARSDNSIIILIICLMVIALSFVIKL